MTITIERLYESVETNEGTLERCTGKIVISCSLLYDAVCEIDKIVPIKLSDHNCG